MSEKILRISAVKQKTGLSASGIYLKIKENTFPKSISLGTRAVGWISSDVDNWIEKKIKESRGEV